MMRGTDVHVCYTDRRQRAQKRRQQSLVEGAASTDHLFASEWLATMCCELGAVICVSFSSNDDLLACGSVSQKLHVYATSNGHHLCEITAEEQSQQLPSAAATDGAPETVAAGTLW